MSKRGQSKPWKVDFSWDKGAGPKGRVAHVTQDRAETCADNIRKAALIQDRDVTVTVVHRPKKP